MRGYVRRRLINTLLFIAFAAILVLVLYRPSNKPIDDSGIVLMTDEPTLAPKVTATPDANAIKTPEPLYHVTPTPVVVPTRTPNGIDFTPTPKPTPKPVANYMLPQKVILDTGWVYQKGYAQNAPLYRTKENGTAREKLTDSTIYSFSIVGPYIYYTTSESSPIYRCLKDGTGNRTLVDAQATSMVAYADYVYFTSYNQNFVMTLWRIRTDGTQKNSLVSNVAEICHMTGDFMYYIRKEGNIKSIYRCKTDGSANAKLPIDHASFLQVVNDKIYYVKAAYPSLVGQFAVSNLDGSNQTKNSSYMMTDFIVAKDKVYFQNAENGFLASMNLDGTGYQALSTKPATTPSMAGNWLYFKGYHGQFRVKLDGTSMQHMQGDETMQYASDYKDGWLYYSNEIGEGLYRLKLDGTQRQKLYDKTPKNIVVYGKWVYFTLLSDSKSTIYRIHTDGSGFEKVECINQNITASGGMCISNGQIYSAVNGKLYSLDPESGIATYVTDMPQRAIVYAVNGNAVAYQNVNKTSIAIWGIAQKADLFSVSFSKMQGGTNYYIDSKYLYFCSLSDGAVHRINWNGQNEMVLGKKVTVIFTYGPNIFYRNSSEDNALYSYNFDIKSDRKVMSDYAGKMMMAADSFILFAGHEHYEPWILDLNLKPLRRLQIKQFWVNETA